MWRRTHRQAAGASPRVIVVGAGFAGLAAVEELDRAGARVLLIDRNVYSTFQPLLYQVATGGLNPGDVSYPARAFTRRHGARFRLGEVTGVDPAAREVSLADGGRFGYDYLILATGVSAAYYGVTGAAEHSLGLYTRRDAVELRNHIMARLERLDIAGPGQERELHRGRWRCDRRGTGRCPGRAAQHRAGRGLSRGGPGVGAHPAGRAGGRVAAAVRATAARIRARRAGGRGVEVRLDTAIREVRSDRVILASGEDLPSDVTVWAAGVSAPADGGRMAAAAGPRRAHPGRSRPAGARPAPDLRPGDLALIGDQPAAAAGAARPADRPARRPADRRLAAGQAAEPFRYHDKGIMATIGRRSAVVELPHRIRIRGTLAWLAWLGLHLSPCWATGTGCLPCSTCPGAT